MPSGSGFHTTIVYNNYVYIAEKQAEMITLGMRKIMEMAKADAKRVLVKGHGYDTGTLRKSIYYRNVGELVYEMFTHVEYAHYVEFGTSKMRAMPFMFPAAKTAGGRIDTMVAAVLAQGFV